MGYISAAEGAIGRRKVNINFTHKNKTSWLKEEVKDMRCPQWSRTSKNGKVIDIIACFGGSTQMWILFTVNRRKAASLKQPGKFLFKFSKVIITYNI